MKYVYYACHHKINFYVNYQSYVVESIKNSNNLMAQIEIDVVEKVKLIIAEIILK